MTRAIRALGRALLLALLAGVLPAGAARAQDWPSRPIRLVVPTGAGGITDILARMVGEKLTEALGQPVVIENRTGAGGIVGTEAVVRAPPDGYTLLMVFPSHPVNPSVYASLPYDTERDLAPVTMVTSVSAVLLVPPTVPARSVGELLALARTAHLTYASVGNGSLAHLSAELFKSLAGVPITHVPFRSAPLAQNALLSGEVTMFFDTPVTALPQVQAGKLLALGISTTKRSAVFPGVPTIAEAGVPGYEVTGWNGILAPARTPRPVIDRLNAAIVAALRQPAMIERLAAQGLEPVGNTPEAFAAVIGADIAKWRRVVQAAGIKAE